MNDQERARGGGGGLSAPAGGGGVVCLMSGSILFGQIQHLHRHVYFILDPGAVK
jgi:hypothetical protein